MKKTRLLALMMALVLCMLAGCGNSQNDNGTSSAAENTSSAADDKSSAADDASSAADDASSAAEDNSSSAEEKSSVAEGMISATIILVLEDKSEVKHEIIVKKDQTIRQALYEAGLIDDENNVSMFVSTIDGHTADAMNDGVTWLPCDENGEMLTGGATDVICSLDAHKVSDGQTIKLVYTVVPNFDD